MRRRSTRGLRGVLALAGVLMLTAACTADAEVVDRGQAISEPSAQPVTTEQPADQAGADDTAIGFSVTQALQQIPASASEGASGTIEVVMADIDAAADQARLRRPIDTSDSDQLFDFFGSLSSGSGDDRPLRLFVRFPVLFHALGGLDEFVAETGFSPGDMTSFVSLESAPFRFTVVSGVDVRDDLPEVVPGVRTLGEGEDLAIGLGDGVTAARPLGRPLRVAEHDGRTALSLTTTPVIDWLTGPITGTLADDPVLAAMASHLDDQRVVSAAMFKLEGERYQGVSLGWSADDRGIQAVVVFSYASAGAAGDHAPQIEASFGGESFATGLPISDLVTLESIDVQGAEIVAVVRFPEERNPDTIYTMLLRRDGPFATG